VDAALVTRLAGLHWPPRNQEIAMSPKNPARVPDPGEEILKGHDVRSLGPSDSSDTGADMVGLGGLDGTSDRQGTGERGSVDPELPGEDGDLRPNRIVRADEAGLGGGLDQAEEAQLGITDEELDRESNGDE
jgi:hypothetical protein